MINAMVENKTKYNFKEPIGILNGSAAVISIVALFLIIFYNYSLIIIFTNGFYFILFAINAYFARARILGYIFPTWLNWVMGLTAVGTILISMWAIFSAVS